MKRSNKLFDEIKSEMDSSELKIYSGSQKKKKTKERINRKSKTKKSKMKKKTK